MTDIIFVEDNFDIEKINLNQIDLEQSKIFTLNFNAHIILNKKNIQHEIAESYISKDDRVKIFDASVKFRDWHKQHPNLNRLLFKGINIIEIFDLNELQQLFLERLYKLLIVKRILERYKPEKFLASESLKYIIESVSSISKSTIEIFPKPTTNSSYFDKYQIDYKIGSLPISFQIKRTRLTKIKKWYEKIATIQNFWYDENEITKGILFLEFDPTQYEELFNQLKKLDINIILLNTRKSAIWNSKSISVVKKYNCKLINESQKKLSEMRQITTQIKSYITLTKEKEFSDDIKQLGNKVIEKIVAIESELYQNKIKTSQDEINYARKWTNHITHLYDRITTDIQRPNDGMIKRLDELTKNYNAIISPYKAILENDLNTFTSFLKEKGITGIIID